MIDHDIPPHAPQDERIYTLHEEYSVDRIALPFARMGIYMSAVGEVIGQGLRLSGVDKEGYIAMFFGGTFFLSTAAYIDTYRNMKQLEKLARENDVNLP